MSLVYAKIKLMNVFHKSYYIIAYFFIRAKPLHCPAISMGLMQSGLTEDGLRCLSTIMIYLLSAPVPVA